MAISDAVKSILSKLPRPKPRRRPGTPPSGPMQPQV